ncbi:unnamed protein product [Gongylonema pulchrum]|uniref:Transposase n=1 Tax=Gongylonema pulchrum TaxID=637853 RepID=A0A183E8M3_9BILA|nr:unnamed protein product [Gongylonema pulchrum]
MRKAKVQSERIRAWIELRRIKSRCVDLYFYWLDELLRMEVIPEICAATMHLVMIGNCQWFLARYGTIS